MWAVAQLRREFSHAAWRPRAADWGRTVGSPGSVSGEGAMLAHPARVALNAIHVDDGGLEQLSRDITIRKLLFRDDHGDAVKLTRVESFHLDRVLC